MIKAIPIFEDVEDSWAWHPAPNGIFSVKSAYKLFRVEPDRPGMANPQAVDASFSWSMIWNANITPQAKQFLWRIARNSLLHRWSILHRG
jgi:hypothetical protein